MTRHTYKSAALPVASIKYNHRIKAQMDANPDFYNWVLLCVIAAQQALRRRSVDHPMFDIEFPVPDSLRACGSLIVVYESKPGEFHILDGRD